MKTRKEISDAGLVHLKGLTKLTYLYLTNTQVTDAGIAGLKKALPNCAINHEPLLPPVRVRPPAASPASILVVSGYAKRRS